MAIVMRNGVEVWIEQDKIQALKNALMSSKEHSRFIEVDGKVINTADVVGIFDPKTMEDMTHRKNGRYKCQFGVWHERNDKCGCWEIERYNRIDASPKAN